MKSIREALNRRQNGEAGFTLVEMLVVIVIVGILAAVAIPIYMNQRKKGWISAVESDVKSAAIAVSTDVANNGYSNLANAITCGETNGTNKSGDSKKIGEESINCSAHVKLVVEKYTDSTGTDTGFKITGTRENLSDSLTYTSLDSKFENNLS